MNPAPSSPLKLSSELERPIQPTTHLSSDLALPTSPFVQRQPTQQQQHGNFYKHELTTQGSLAYPMSSDAPTNSDARRFSDMRLSSQRSVETLGNSSRRRRGDVLQSRALDSFLQSQSDLPLETGRVASSHLTSDPTAVKRVIWGTNVDVAESMAMFKDFIANFTQALKIRATNPEAPLSEADQLPFYDHYLSEVDFSSLTP